jgi:outer membrane protein TolC
VVPVIPSILPSALLERRPDVAAAERLVAAANANIGIQRAAFFPQLSLTGQAGQSAGGLGTLFSVASSAWSLGLTGVLSLLDFGANKAKVAGARAAYEQAVATYRQTALTAFQQTEDQLAAVRILETVAGDRAAASIAADQAEAIARNQYQAGQIAYSGVIVAQTTALTARVANVQAIVNRQSSAISLIQAIGGRWTDS